MSITDDVQIVVQPTAIRLEHRNTAAPWARSDLRRRKHHPPTTRAPRRHGPSARLLGRSGGSTFSRTWPSSSITDSEERSATPGIAGVVRARQNWIGGSSYNPCGAAFVPPPPETLDALLGDLLAYVNGDDHPALVQAAIAHAQFETIHPFADGNGRTGRALIHVILRRRGLEPWPVPPVTPPRPHRPVRFREDQNELHVLGVSGLKCSRATGNSGGCPERGRLSGIRTLMTFGSEPALRARSHLPGPRRSGSDGVDTTQPDIDFRRQPRSCPGNRR